MNVYCDVVEHVVVGDIMAPLLRIVGMKLPTDHGTMHRMLTPSILCASVE